MDIYNLRSESEIQELLKTPVENLKYEKCRHKNSLRCA